MLIFVLLLIYQQDLESLGLNFLVCNILDLAVSSGYSKQDFNK